MPNFMPQHPDDAFRRQQAPNTPKSVTQQIVEPIAGDSGIMNILGTALVNAYNSDFSRQMSRTGMSNSEFAQGGRLRNMDRDAASYGSAMDAKNLGPAVKMFNEMFGMNVNPRTVNNALRSLGQFGQAVFAMHGGSDVAMAQNLNRMSMTMENKDGTLGLSSKDVESMAKAFSTYFRNENGTPDLTKTKAFTVDEISDGMAALQEMNMLRMNPFDKEKSMDQQGVDQAQLMVNMADAAREAFKLPDASIRELVQVLDNKIGPGLARMDMGELTRMLSRATAASAVTGISAENMINQIGASGMGTAAAGYGQMAGQRFGESSFMMGAAVQRMQGRGQVSNDPRYGASPGSVASDAQQKQNTALQSQAQGGLLMLKKRDKDGEPIRDPELREYMENPYSEKSRNMLKRGRLTSLMAKEFKMRPGEMAVMMQDPASNAALMDELGIDPFELAKQQALANIDYGTKSAYKAASRQNDEFKKVFSSSEEMYQFVTETAASGQDVGKAIQARIDERGVKGINADTITRTMQQWNLRNGLGADQMGKDMTLLASEADYKKMQRQTDLTQKAQESIRSGGMMQALSRTGPERGQALANMYKEDGKFSKSDILNFYTGVTSPEMAEEMYRGFGGINDLVDKGAENQKIIAKVKDYEDNEAAIKRMEAEFKASPEFAANEGNRSDLAKLYKKREEMGSITDEDREKAEIAKIENKEIKAALANAITPEVDEANAKYADFQREAERLGEVDPEMEKLKEEGKKDPRARKKYIDKLREKYNKFGVGGEYGKSNFVFTSMGENTGRYYQEMQAEIGVLDGLADRENITDEEWENLQEFDKNAQRGLTNMSKSPVKSYTRALGDIQNTEDFEAAKRAREMDPEELKRQATGETDEDRAVRMQREEAMAMAGRLAGGDPTLSVHEEAFHWTDEQEKKYKNYEEAQARDQATLDASGSSETAKNRARENIEKRRQENGQLLAKRQNLANRVQERREKAGEAPLEGDELSAAIGDTFGSKAQAIRESGKHRQESGHISREAWLDEQRGLGKSVIEKIELEKKAGAEGEKGKGGGGFFSGDVVIKQGGINRDVKTGKITIELS